MTNIFDNAKTVEYNGKEVKTITTTNGGVIWEKEEPSNYLTLTARLNSQSFGTSPIFTGDTITVDWGDGTEETLTTLTNKNHSYSDGLNEHTITLIGEVTELPSGSFGNINIKDIYIPSSVVSFGDGLFSGKLLQSIIFSENCQLTQFPDGCFASCNQLTSITIPDTIISIGGGCFGGCSSLTSITIPNSVTNLGNNCFSGCTSLIDYQLYWEDSAIIQYDSNKMSNNPNTVFTIPNGETSNYVAKGYPSDKLVERGSHNYSLSLQSNKDILSYADSDSATLTATLTDNNQPVSGETVSYTVKHGATVLDSGTDTTDANGEISFTYTSTGIGDVDIEVSYGIILQETYTIEDCTYYNTNTYSRSDVTFNIALPNHFIMSYDFNTNRRTGGSSPYILIGDDSTHKLLVGQYAQSGANGIGVYNGSSTGTFTNMSTSPLNTWFTFTFTYNGETYHLTDGTNELTLNAVSTIPLSKLLQTIGGGGGGELKNIKIKPLESSPSHDYALSIASTKDILSYADSESATVTGTLTDNSVAVAGETLSYTVKQGSTVLDSGSDTTDNNGEISFTYTSTGIGDVTIEVDYGILLQETFVIEDLLLYDPMTSNSGHWSVPSDATYQYNDYSSNGWKIGNASAYKYIPVDVDLTLPFKVSCIINGQSGNNPGFNFGGRYVEFYNNRISINGSNSNHSLQYGSEYSVHFYSDHIEVWKGDTYINRNTVSVSSTPTFSWSTGGNRYMQIKDVKIKAL